MADLRVLPDDYIVEASDWATVQTNVENADRDVVMDLHGAGIAYGLELTERPTPSMSLSVAAGVAYDAIGRRVELAAPTTVSLSVDSDGASTAVSSGQERYVAVYLRFKRTNSDAYTADTVTTYRTQTESSELVVVKGASASLGTGVVPGAPTGNPILLGRVKITNGMTAILTTNILFGAVPILRRASDIHANSVQRFLECSPTDPPSMAVVVTAGKVNIDGTWKSYAGGTTSTITAPSSHPRIDLVCLDSTGALTVVTGTEAASPSKPSTRGKLPIAFITLAVGQTTITDTDIVDGRAFLQTQTVFRDHYSALATASQTVITLPFAYTTGTHALDVYVDGVLKPESSYTETSSTSVTLGAGLSGGERITVYALRASPLESVPLAQVSDTLSGLALGGGIAVEDRGSGNRIYIDPLALCVIGNRSYRDADGDYISGSWSAYTWYYVHAYVSGGALAYTALSGSGNTPDGALTWRDDGLTTPTHRFLGAFRTDGLGQALQCYRRGCDASAWTYYQRSAVSNPSNLEALTAGTDTSWTDVPLASLVPPHARMVEVEVEVVTSSGGTGGVDLRTKGAAVGAQTYTLTGEAIASTVQTFRGVVRMFVNASQVIQYRRSGGTYGGAITLRVIGYQG